MIKARDNYRDGWKPLDNTERSYCIINYMNMIDTKVGGNGENHVLSFQSRQVMEKFLEDYKDKIIKCIDFI